MLFNLPQIIRLSVDKFPNKILLQRKNLNSIVFLAVKFFSNIFTSSKNRFTSRMFFHELRYVVDVPVQGNPTVLFGVVFAEFFQDVFFNLCCGKYQNNLLIGFCLIFRFHYFKIYIFLNKFKVKMEIFKFYNFLNSI